MAGPYKPVGVDADSLFPPRVETRLSAAFAPASFARDIRTYLAPGASLDRTGASSIASLLQLAVTDLEAEYAAQSGAFGKLGYQIVFPAGDYKVDARIILGGGVGIRGESMSGTVFHLTGTAVLATIASTVFTAFLDDITFSDFTIDCTGQSSAPDDTGTKAIALRWMRRGRFERVRSVGSWATAFGCDFLQDTVFIDCHSENSGRGVTTSRWGVGAGFGIGVGEYLREQVTFVNCTSLDAYSSGFFFERLAGLDTPSEGVGISLQGCSARGGYVGLQDAGAHNLRADSCDFSENAMSGIAARGSSSALGPRHGGHDGVISNTLVMGNGGETGSAGILFAYAGGGGYTVHGCTIIGNTGPGVYAPDTARVGAGHRLMQNTIIGNTGPGVYYGAETIDRLVVDGNVIRDNSRASVGVPLGGVIIANDNIHARVTDNDISGHYGPPVALLGAAKTAVYPLISGNRFSENSGGDVVNEQGTTVATAISGNLADASFSTIINYCINPSVETDTTGWGNQTNCTFSRVAATTDGGLYVVRAVATASAGAVLLRAPNQNFGVASGDVWTLSAWIKAPANRIAVMRALFNGNSWFEYRYSGEFRTTGDWQRIHITVVVPIVVAPALPPTGVQPVINFESPGVVAGDVIDIDRVMVTKGATLWPYFDGDSAGATWNATAHASRSTFTVPTA